MGKHEFLEELRTCLTGQVSTLEVEDAVNYYDSYITEETAKGQKEEDVIAAIGEPRIISKSIIAASENKGKSGFKRTVVEEDGGTPDDRKAAAAGKLKLYGTLAVIAIIVCLVLIALTKVIAFFFPLIVVIIILVWLFGHKGGGQ